PGRGEEVAGRIERGGTAYDYIVRDDAIGIGLGQSRRAHPERIDDHAVGTLWHEVVGKLETIIHATHADVDIGIRDRVVVDDHVAATPTKARLHREDPPALDVDDVVLEQEVADHLADCRIVRAEDVEP